jgi:integrase
MVGRDRQLISIGRYPEISLLDARTVAKEKLAEITLGKHRPKPMVFRDALALFLKEKAVKNKASTLYITRLILNKHFKPLHARHLSEITPADIARITDSLVSTHPSAANHAFVAGRTFFKWCTRRGYIAHSPIENLERPARLVTRERVLSDDELRAVWKSAGGCGTFGQIVKLLIVTGQRRSEIASLQSDWICGLEESATTGAKALRPVFLDKNVETVAALFQPTICLPSTITKNRRQHTFPLGAIATFTLKRIMEGQSSLFLFLARGIHPPKPFNGWSKAKAHLDKKVRANSADLDIKPWTLHDLRRTYATNLQRLGIRLEVIEALLNHVSGTRAGIVGVYNRHRYEAEMRQAVELYEKWLRENIVSC